VPSIPFDGLRPASLFGKVYAWIMPNDSLCYVSGGL
jgi:hypothetical protein